MVEVFLKYTPTLFSLLNNERRNSKSSRLIYFEYLLGFQATLVLIKNNLLLSAHIGSEIWYLHVGLFTYAAISFQFLNTLLQDDTRRL